MPKVTIAPVVLQTTRSEGWYVHGLAIGAGTSLDSSVMELETEAQHHAQQLARDLGHDGQTDAEWHFRVEDIRITAGPVGCAPDEAWVAYGTLTSWGQTPWSAGR